MLCDWLISDKQIKTNQQKYKCFDLGFLIVDSVLVVLNQSWYWSWSSCLSLDSISNGTNFIYQMYK